MTQTTFYKNWSRQNWRGRSDLARQVGNDVMQKVEQNMLQATLVSWAIAHVMDKDAFFQACNIHNSENLPEIRLADVLSGKESISTTNVVRFVFSAHLRHEARTLLLTANLSPRTMYPDLEGVARSLKGM